MTMTRQETAEELRKMGEEIDQAGNLSMIGAFIKIDRMLGTQNTRYYAPFFNRLADLIDPTCHMKPNYVSPFDDPQWFMCDKCGNDTEQLENYCPYCGARVVSEDA